jgi:hypothetical protein
VRAASARLAEFAQILKIVTLDKISQACWNENGTDDHTTAVNFDALELFLIPQH